jgi:cytochrome c
MPTPLNSVAVGADGEIAVGGADGKVYFIAGNGTRAGEVQAVPRPVISIAISPDGALVAAAGIGGTVAVIDRKTRTLARTLVGPGLPVWSVAFLPDSRTLLTGGADNLVRRWNAATGEPVDPLLVETAGDPLTAYAGDRGAEIFRACVACHTLGADQANRAGPTLAGIFGRRIATAPGYNFSEALKHLDIVWTPETISRLFEVGPQAYTPGTKMPEQRIGSEQDRAALVQFLERATRQ